MKATLRNVRIAPKKANLIAELIRGERVTDAIDILKFTPKKGAKIMGKLLNSAVANAENNFKQNRNDLYVREVKVSKGYSLKRFIPISRGRAHGIRKFASHIHIFLDNAPLEVPAKAESKKEEPKAEVKEEKKETTKKAPAKKAVAKKAPAKKKTESKKSK